MTKITNSKKIVDSWSIVEEKHIELVQQTGKILSETANNVLNTASEVWDTVQPQLNTFAKQTQKVLGDAANSAFTTASDSLAPVIGEIGALKNQSTNEFSRLVEESKSELNQFAQNVGAFLSDVPSNVSNKVSEVANTVSEVANTVSDSINSAIARTASAYDYATKSAIGDITAYLAETTNSLTSYVLETKNDYVAGLNRDIEREAADGKKLVNTVNSGLKTTYNFVKEYAEITKPVIYDIIDTSIVATIVASKEAANIWANKVKPGIFNLAVETSEVLYNTASNFVETVKNDINADLIKMETDAGVIKNDMLIAKNSISSAVNSLVSTFGNNDIGNMTFANKYVTSTDYVQDNNFVIDLNLIGTEDNPTDII